MIDREDESIAMSVAGLQPVRETAEQCECPPGWRHEPGCPEAYWPVDACVCAEINIRHCPVHGQDTVTAFLDGQENT